MNILLNVSEEKLKGFLYEIEGLRRAWENYNELKKRAKFIEDTFRSFNLAVETQDVPFYGKTYQNIIATMKGVDGRKNEMILIGDHYDAAWGSQGADDNASGVAVLLETARILSKQKLNRAIQFVAFTLEEPQLQTTKFLIVWDT